MFSKGHPGIDQPFEQWALADCRFFAIGGCGLSERVLAVASNLSGLRLYHPLTPKYSQGDLLWNPAKIFLIKFLAGLIMRTAG